MTVIELEERREEIALRKKYRKARQFALMLGVTAMVEEGIFAFDGCIDREHFCQNLCVTMFILNDEIHPTTKLVTDAITPEMLDWYSREMENV